LKKPKEADQAFRAALADDPQSRPARFDYARFLNEQGQRLEALKLLNHCAGVKPEETLAWQLGGEIALQQRELLEFALEWTGEAVKHCPQDAVICRQRAEALLLSGDSAAALPVWQELSRSKDPLALAAVVVCELLVNEACTRCFGASEPAVSKELVQWYRRFLRFETHALIHTRA
jgi:predicted Zn-dependent protease